MHFLMGPHMRQFRFIARTPPRRALRARLLAGMLIAMPIVFTSGANAQALRYAPTQDAFPPDDVTGEQQDPEGDNVLPERLRRAVVSFSSNEAPGTIVIDTANTTLYYVLGQGRAIRYGVGVGREGFTWSGVQTITRKMVWPDWHPPAEMIARQPYLPRFMAGGRGNPLGARAMYLGSSEFRIHGTNDPTTIGKFVSSGCIRLTNDDVIDLASRIDVGTKVIVLPKTARLQARGMTTIRPTAARSRALALPRYPGREAMISGAVAVY
jgi:lipoprotein-anchoring transpeptidase ErfK/SrfK